MTSHFTIQLPDWEQYKTSILLRLKTKSSTSNVYGFTGKSNILSMNHPVPKISNYLLKIKHPEV